MSEVRKHQRVTASGKRTTVRRHTRSGDKTRREDEAEAAREAWADRNAPHVSSLPAAAAESPAEEWWAEDGLPPPGEFWDEDDAGEDGEHLHPDWATVEHEGHTFKVNRAPAYQPQGDHDFADSKADKKAARARLKAAEEALAENAEREKEQGIDYETDRYHELNDEYWEARKAADLPWWRNW